MCDIICENNFDFDGFNNKGEILSKIKRMPLMKTFGN